MVFIFVITKCKLSYLCQCWEFFSLIYPWYLIQTYITYQDLTSYSYVSFQCNLQSSCMECKCEVIFVAVEWSLAMGHSVLQIITGMERESEQRQNRKRSVARNQEGEPFKCKHSFVCSIGLFYACYYNNLTTNTNRSMIHLLI